MMRGVENAKEAEFERPTRADDAITLIEQRSRLQFSIQCVSRA
jgi:hypothetical protein